MTEFLRNHVSWLWISLSVFYNLQMSKEHLAPKSMNGVTTKDWIMRCCVSSFSLSCFVSHCLNSCIYSAETVYTFCIGACIYPEPAVCLFCNYCWLVLSQDPFAFYVCFRFIVLTVVIFKLLFSFHKERALSLLRAELHYDNHLLEKRKLPVIFMLWRFVVIIQPPNLLTKSIFF